MTWKADCLSEFADFFKWTPPPWLRSAACRQGSYRPSWWFNRGSRKIDAKLRERAKSICIYECPVRWRCLAKYSTEPEGIFGGLDAEQRKLLLLGVHYTQYHDPDALRLKVENRLRRERSGVIVSIRVS